MLKTIRLKYRKLFRLTVPMPTKQAIHALNQRKLVQFDEGSLLINA